MTFNRSLFWSFNFFFCFLGRSVFCLNRLAFSFSLDIFRIIIKFTTVSIFLKVTSIKAFISVLNPCFRLSSDHFNFILGLSSFFLYLFQQLFRIFVKFQNVAFIFTERLTLTKNSCLFTHVCLTILRFSCLVEDI